MSSSLVVFVAGIVFAEALLILKQHGHCKEINENRFALSGWVVAGLLFSSVHNGCMVHFAALLGLGFVLHPMVRHAQELLALLSQQRTASFRTADVDGCREIIKSGTPPHESDNILSRLEARARPNQRLKMAFGIESCFTSSDEKSCKHFRLGVETLLHVDNMKWSEFADAAVRVASQALNGKVERVSLFSVVHILTHKTMMKVLWNRDPKETGLDEQIAALAHEVNLQWLRSKEEHKNEDSSWFFEEQTELKDAIKAVFPNWDEKDGKENPCNWILPGYETMWRVVLRCFLEVKSRQHSQATDWKKALHAFLIMPKAPQLREPVPNSDSQVAAINVAQEVLRLYPPTRRIYREYHDATNRKTNVAADIEAMQRDPNIWKNKPNLFVPERWIGVEEGFDKGYMPFGNSPFNCPAKRWRHDPIPFGVSMISLLVGALVEATEDKWEVQADLPEKQCPLDTHREAYKMATLQRL